MGIRTPRSDISVIIWLALQYTRRLRAPYYGLRPRGLVGLRWVGSGSLPQKLLSQHCGPPWPRDGDCSIRPPSTLLTKPRCYLPTPTIPGCIASDHRDSEWPPTSLCYANPPLPGGDLRLINSMPAWDACSPAE
ncbi:hypothetical protein AGIG_G17019 [Arapaima gigas]